MPMGNGTMHKMWMYFHTEANDTLLFSFWTVQTALAMAGSCLILLLAAFFLEVLKWFRLVIEQRQLDGSTGVRVPPANRRYIDSLLGRGHLLQTALFSLQLLLSYLLMLAIMTFSLWVLLAVCAGAALGFWLFGRRHSVLVSSSSPNTSQPH